jgi:surface polysaccharide O-acyltransferase-like enzyme
MVLFYFAGFLIVCLGVVAFRHRPATARVLYRIALLLATLPYLLHVRYTWGWVSGFGDPSPRIGVYPGLVAFAATGVVAAVALGTLAWVALRRVPVATVALPLALWLAHWFGSLRLIYWRAPDFVPVDNRPLIWLFAFSAVATVLLAMSLLVGRRRSPQDSHQDSE